MSLEMMDDKDLFDKLEKAGLAEKLENSPEWRLLKEASTRIVEKAVAKLVLSTKATDLLAIVELQTVIRKYKYGLFEEISMLKEEAKMYEAEILERTSLDSASTINRP
jgi:hypothetical protein